MPVVEQPAASRKSTGLPPAAKRGGSMTRLIACCVCACLESQISRLSGSFLLVFDLLERDYLVSNDNGRNFQSF